MIRSDARYLACLGCGGRLDLTVFAPGAAAGVVRDGVLACASCRTVYPVQDHIPLLIGTEWYPEEIRREFVRAWGGSFPFAEHPFYSRTITDGKIRQQAFFNDGADLYTHDVGASPFWQALDALVLEEWCRLVPATGPVLDIGCGLGRCSIPLARHGLHVIATDLSLMMVREARTRAAAAGFPLTFFLADAEQLPVQPAALAAITSYGMLHHAEEPGLILAGASRALQAGGIFLALENHASPVRPLFDLLMRLHKLWDEEAGTEPTFRWRDLRVLAQRHGFTPSSRFRVYLPPHALAAAGAGTAKGMLRITDAVFGALPLLRYLGGEIELIARKTAAAGN